MVIRAYALKRSFLSLSFCIVKQIKRPLGNVRGSHLEIREEKFWHEVKGVF